MKYRNVDPNENPVRGQGPSAPEKHDSCELLKPSTLTKLVLAERYSRVLRADHALAHRQRQVGRYTSKENVNDDIKLH